MPIIRKLASVNALATALCACALVAYLVLAPAAAKGFACASCQCEYASLCYDQGACRGGQRCKNNASCTNPHWDDDEECLAEIQ